jgi:hypothetical protein
MVNRKASSAPDGDARAHLLRALDAHLADFAQETQSRIQAGRAIAEADSEILTHLAGTIASSLHSWRQLVDRLDIARAAAFDPVWAGQCLLESVFEPVLAPSAWRVLAAALPLAQTRA